MTGDGRKRGMPSWAAEKAQGVESGIQDWGPGDCAQSHLDSRAWSAESARVGITHSIRRFRLWGPGNILLSPLPVGENRGKREDVVEVGGMHANNFIECLHNYNMKIGNQIK